jgi:choline monooxygenase
MVDKFRSILSKFLKNKVPAHGLPAASYTSKELWEIECRTILADGWIFAGFAHELSNSGDVTPISIAGKPVILVKNLKNEIVAFHNVCRHRCLKLVNQKKNVGKLIRCPYHAWAYDLKGDLRASPHFGGTNQNKPKGFDPTNYGLKQIRVAVWHDWIFVNLNGKALPFKKYAKALINQLSDINFNKIRPVATLEFGKIYTNWKFLMENFIEPYHVQFVHKKTTNQPLRDHYVIVDGICLGSAVDLNEKDRVKDNLSVSSRYLTLFPNFIIGRYFPNQLGVYLNVPFGPGLTTQKRIIYTTDGKKMKKNEIENQKKLWWNVHKEDHEICERLQLGRASPVSKEGGILSPHWEKSVLEFQKLVVKGIMKFKKNNKGNPHD